MDIIDLEMVRGDDEEFVFEVFELIKHKNGTTDELPLDYTNHRLDMHIKASKSETVKLSSTTGDIVANGNVITVKLHHDKTRTAMWRTAEYDLQVIDQYGKVSTPFGGVFELQHDITDITEVG